MHKSLSIGLAVIAFGLAGGAGAQPSTSTEIAELRAELAALMERLARLEQGSAAAVEASAAAPAAASTAPPAAPAQNVAGADRQIRFSGDMRYRHEAINEEGGTERERQRIRARFGVTADINDSMRVGLQLATGNDDPVSANQTLDGGFSRKSIGVDRAYFSWQANDKLSITGGKMGIPFFRPGNHHLLYDSDLNPEGLALRYDSGNWFANYAGLWVEERSAADDSIMLAGQFGYRHELDNGMRLTAGVSYYDYLNTQGQAPFWSGSAEGNFLDSAGNYLYDFNEAELFGEIRLKAGDHPVTIFADYVVNTEAALEDRGFALGASLGEVTRPGTWRVGYAYQDLEANAVIGTFTDSDFGGGGADGKGHVVEFNYGLRERLAFGFRYFINERGAGAGNQHDYNRLQADLSFSY